MMFSCWVGIPIVITFVAVMAWIWWPDDRNKK